MVKLDHILRFTVRPSIPEELKEIEDLAYNLLWCWDHEAIDLFRRIDEDLWEETSHNPVLMLNKLTQEKYSNLLADEAFMEHFERVKQIYRKYLSEQNTWFSKLRKTSSPLFAYFSAEWGVTECMRIYSGGLGILAGDFLKSSSDLGVPVVGVGLLYQQGYFRQYLNMDGWQQETEAANDFFNLPARCVLDENGNPVMVVVPVGNETVLTRAWVVSVGRLPLYLLDTNIPENRQEHRQITWQLYGGDIDMRIRQEIVLGIGGVRILKAIGIHPLVYHMNEGHSAFLAIERIRQLMQDHRLCFEGALELARRSNVFTTHTPVPAGIDEFPAKLVDTYLGRYLGEMGISIDVFLGMGRLNPNSPDEPFNMARFAIRQSAYINGVSRLHRDVSRNMWAGMWSSVPMDEIPIDYVTNGIHIASWVSRDMASLFNRYLGSGWIDRPTDEKIWDGVWRIPDAELWRTHERRRERLISFVRKCLARQLSAQGASREAIRKAEEVLDPSALTIGFARRFATYKRANLLLRNPERLKRILTDPQRPVQIIFSGKAHPQDNRGKQLIREIIHFIREEGLGNHIVFVEDYNMIVSRYLVEGVDLWLNTPLRPMEASGTSGMKVVPNGGLNVSTIDGWWNEAYSPEVGWAIGKGEDYSDIEYQNHVEANALYDLLEREIIPLFYDRGRDGLPRQWIAMMKRSMRNLCHFFNTDRMVKEYTRKFYLPALSEYESLKEEDFSKARELAVWISRLRSSWGNIRIESVEAEISGDERVGSRVPVKSRIHLGGLDPEDVAVEIYFGSVDASGKITNAKIIEMSCDPDADGTYLYKAVVPCEDGGNQGLTVRVIPSRRKITNPLQLGLITWAVL
ncbi:MAG: alpha-glucan family phosphorylase [bacterium]